MDSNAHPQQLPRLELYILTRRVGLYSQPPANITSDTLAQSTMMTTDPPNTIPPFSCTCLLSGSLADFLPFSGQEKSQWLINVAHDICDPSQRRGSLLVWDVTVPEPTWRMVSSTDPLTASMYLYSVQAVVSLLKIS